MSFCRRRPYKGAVVHRLPPLIDDELPVLEERLGGVAEPQANDTEVVADISDVLRLHEVGVPLLQRSDRSHEKRFSVSTLIWSIIDRR